MNLSVVFLYIPYVDRFFVDKDMIFFVSLLLTFIFYFIGLVILLLSIVVIHRQIQNKIERNRALLKDLIHDEILEYLFEPDKQMDVLLDMVEVKSNFVRQVIIDFLVVLHENLEGSYHERIQSLYEQAQLSNLSFEKLNSRNWSTKIIGFRELSRMDVVDAKSKIYTYLNHKNPIVSLEAKLALIRLSPNEPLWFLDKFEKGMSSWAKINIYNSLKNSYVHIPQFNKWLISDNNSVVIFSLKMIALYKQVDAFNDVQRLLYHSNELVRRHTIETMTYLHLERAQKILYQKYMSETVENKKVIAACLHGANDDSAWDFYEQNFIEEDDFDLKLEHAYGLVAQGDKASLFFNSMEKTANKAYKKIIAHVTDDRINYRVPVA